MFSVILLLFIRFPTIMEYCTDIRVINKVYTMPDPGFNPEPFDCKSGALRTELCAHWTFFRLKMYEDVKSPDDHFEQRLLNKIYKSLLRNHQNAFWYVAISKECARA